MRYSHPLHRHNQQHNPKKLRLQRILSLIFAGTFLLVLLALNRYQIFNIPEFFTSLTISLYRVIIAYFIAAIISIFWRYLLQRMLLLKVCSCQS